MQKERLINTPLLICFPNLPVATDEKCPVLTLQTILIFHTLTCKEVCHWNKYYRKSLWNSKKPQHTLPSRFLCGMPEHYFQHCSSTALPVLCLHKLMPGTHRGDRGLPLLGMLSHSFWRLSSVKLYPALNCQNKMSLENYASIQQRNNWNRKK